MTETTTTKNVSQGIRRVGDSIIPWALRNSPQILVLAGIVYMLITLYNDITYMKTVINPDSVADWREQQARTNAKFKAHETLAVQRHCIIKAWFNGAAPTTTLDCVD